VTCALELVGVQLYVSETTLPAWKSLFDNCHRATTSASSRPEARNLKIGDLGRANVWESPTSFPRSILGVERTLHRVLCRTIFDYIKSAKAV